MSRSPVALCAAAILCGAPARAQNGPPPPEAERAAYRVEVTLRDLAGRPIATANAGDTFRLTLKYHGAEEAPRRKLAPLGWLRRVVAGRPSCGEAARIGRVTMALSAGDIALQGDYLLALDRGGRLATINPDMNLASANISSLSGALGAVGTLLPHPEAQMAFLSRPEAGDVIAIGVPHGTTSTFSRGLGRPGDMVDVADGGLLVADDQGGRIVRLDSRGRVSGEIAVGPGPVALTRAGPDKALAVAANGAAALMNRLTGEPISRFDGVGRPFAATGSGVLSASGGDSVELRYFDDPDRAVPFRTIAVPDGISVSSDGARALVWSASDQNVVVLDIATGRSQPIIHAFKAADAVDEVTFAGASFFLTFRRRPVVTVIDLTLLEQTQAENVTRDVWLTERAAVPDLTGGRRLISLHPQPSIRTVRPGSRTLFTVMAGGGPNAAPMLARTLPTQSPQAHAPDRSTALRTEPPIIIAAFERRLRETEAGTFETLLRIDRGGAYELVTTTGVAGTTACAPIQIEGAGVGEANPPRLVVSVPEGAKAGVKAALVFDLKNYADGRTASTLELRAAALDGSNWSQRVVATKEGDGLWHAHTTFPRAGRYPVVPALGGRSIAPAVVEVAP